MELPLQDTVTWSVSLRDNNGRMPLSSVGSGAPLRTASVGKILLLLEVARAVSAGELDLARPLTRAPADTVRDSGLWHLLSVGTLPLGDVAALVGAVSDNLATNVLVRQVTLDAVARAAAYLGLRETALHDRVRDARGPADPPTLSTGTAGELCDLVWRIDEGSAMGGDADRLVREWLSAGVDQSLVGSAFVARLGLDAIAHHVTLGGELGFWNKTGTDVGVRADVGAARLGEHRVAWAAIANWQPEPADADPVVHHVLDGMRGVGEHLVEALVDGPADGAGRARKITPV